MIKGRSKEKARWSSLEKERGTRLKIAIETRCREEEVRREAKQE